MIREIEPAFWVRNGDVWPFSCSLYLIEERRVGPVKIGVANHPIRRLSILQCGNSRQLFLRAIFAGSRKDCRDVEKAILFRFIASIVRGEWIREPLAVVLHDIRLFSEGAA